MTPYAKISCDLFRDPKMVAAGPIPRLLYIQSVAYCRENLTDGVIDSLLLPLVAVDVPNPTRHMMRLVEVGALEKIDCGWRIPGPVWGKFNPLRSEVDELRREEAERKASWRDRKRRDTARDEGVPVGHNGQSDRDIFVEGEGEGEGEYLTTPLPPLNRRRAKPAITPPTPLRGVS